MSVNIPYVEHLGMMMIDTKSWNVKPYWGSTWSIPVVFDVVTQKQNSSFTWMCFFSVEFWSGFDQGMNFPMNNHHIYSKKNQQANWSLHDWFASDVYLFVIISSFLCHFFPAPTRRDESEQAIWAMKQTLRFRVYIYIQYIYIGDYTTQLCGDYSKP